MTLYNPLPRKEYERVFMCKTTKEVWHTLIITHQGNSQVKDYKIDLLTQQYKKFSILNEETIDSSFTRFNAKVTVIKEAKDVATLPLDELIGNLKVYEMILENDGVVSKTTKKKVKYLAVKAKITQEQTSDGSDSQGGSVEDLDEDLDEEEAKAFNLIAKNFCHRNDFGNKGGEISRQNQGFYNCGEEGHFIGECPKPKENKAFVGGAWSDSEDGNKPQNDTTCLIAIDSQEVLSKPSSSNNDLDIIDLQKENEEIL
ncbi:UBN2 domain-containing protein, partial [Tanacetum coccineum]